MLTTQRCNFHANGNASVMDVIEDVAEETQVA
jgi:hypothetical protein